MQEIDRVKELREQIANRLALDFFVRCLHLPKGITVIDEAREEADGILSLKIDGTTLKELLEKLDETGGELAILSNELVHPVKCLSRKVIWQGGQE